jgi:hypothetical protein
MRNWKLFLLSWGILGEFRSCPASLGGRRKYDGAGLSIDIDTTLGLRQLDE